MRKPRTTKECGCALYSNCSCEVGPVEGFTIDQLVGMRRDGDATIPGDLLEATPIDWPTG